MPISRIKIENFRSVEHCEFSPGKLCALVGENNAGKSNVLKAIHRVLGRDWVGATAFEDEDFIGYDTTRDIVIEVEFDPPLEYRAFKFAPVASIVTLRFTVTHYKIDTKQGKKGDRRVEMKCLDGAGKEVSVLAEAPKTGKAHQYKILSSIPPEVRAQVPLIFIGADRKLADQLPSTRSSLLRRMLMDVDAALRKTTVKETIGDDVVEKNAHALFLERLASALEVLRIKEFVDLEKVLRERALENLGYDVDKDTDRLKFGFALFESFDFFKAMKLVFRESGIDIEATEMGEGAQNALILAIFQAYEQLHKKGAIFLIEEPEMYLHPHRRRFFSQVLRRLAENNQIIYTTHSTHFVSIPEYEEVKLVYRDANNTTKIRWSELLPTEILRERLRKEFDPERNELFFARQVILVEGDSEKLALPEYANRLSIDLNRAGCSVVEVGGKRSLKSFIEIIRSFGIPLTVVFDEDSSEFGKDKKDEEQAYNEELLAFAGVGVRVIQLAPKYEGELRKALGEDVYLALCQKHGGFSKAVQARLVAQDATAPVPPFVNNILRDVNQSGNPADLSTD